MDKNIKVKGTPKTRTVKIAYRPWTLRPVSGGDLDSWCGGDWPEWRASERKYSKEIFADIDEAVAWVEERLNKEVNRINTRKVCSFYGEEFIKGTAKLVRKDNGFRVTAKYEPEWVGGRRRSETYIRGGIKEVEVA